MHALFAATTTSSNPAGLIVPLLLFGGVFYFLLIRPQQRRARQQRELANELSIGDEVLTIGGIYGVVKDVEDDSVTVEIAPGTTVRMVKGAINRRLTGDEEELEDEPEEEPDTSP